MIIGKQIAEKLVNEGIAFLGKPYFNDIYKKTMVHVYRNDKTEIDQFFVRKGE